MSKGFRPTYLLIILSLILAACAAQPTTPEPVMETLVMMEVVEATPVEVIQVATPTPEPDGPRTLVICVANEPEGFRPYGGSGVSDWQMLESVFGGIWWGAIDYNSFSYQPILQEKLPSINDGDAVLVSVTVSEGDTVVDSNGNIVVLDENADPPIRLFPAGGGEPFLYEGGEVEMDQISATFKLLPDLVWSDGTPLTASDSVYAFNLMSDPDNGFDYFSLHRTASYEAIDELTTEWTGLPGFMDFEYFSNFFGPAPEHLWGEYTARGLFESEEYTRRPVGWGPYVIDEWIDGERIILRKNPNYFRADEDLPKFDMLVYRFVGQNSNANIAALLSGECDVVASDLGDQSELLLDLQASGQLKATFTTGVAWEHIDFGIQPREYDHGYQIGVDRPDFFSDMRTRQAFAMCMDRQGLVDNIFAGQSIVLDSFVPPQHPLFNAEVQRYQFDPIAGGALLEEVGWVDDDGNVDTPRVSQRVANVPDGTLLEVEYGTTPSPIRQQVTAIIQESLAKCGIKANVQHYAPSEWFADEGILFGRRFDLGEFAWTLSWCGHYITSQSLGPKGETWVSIQDGATRTFHNPDWEGYNVSGFANADYDAACNAVLGSLPEQPRYEEAFLNTQRIFAENLPTVPLFPYIRIVASRPDMCGLIVDPSANTEFWNIEEFDYGEGCEE